MILAEWCSSIGGNNNGTNGSCESGNNGGGGGVNWLWKTKFIVFKNIESKDFILSFL